MPNYWNLFLCCFFVGHKQTATNLRCCSRCGITEKHLRETTNQWLSFLYMGPKCFLWNVWRVVRTTTRNFVCKNIGHRVKVSLRYYGKLDIKEASLIALGENEESRLIHYGVGVDVKKRRDQLMDDGFFMPVIFCERCQKYFGRHSMESK